MRENGEQYGRADERPAPFSLQARARSFRFAFAGGRVLLTTQHNAWMHAAATVLVVIGGLATRLAPLEWALLALAMGLVWALEAMNTAVELLADEVSLEQRPGIGKAKDVAAFGVLAAAVAAALIGMFVFIPHLFH